MVATLQSNEIGNGMNVLSFLLKQTIICSRLIPEKLQFVL